MEAKREGKKHQHVVASQVPPTRDLARNPGMCPDWESNRTPFGLQSCAQSTEPHQTGLFIDFRKREREKERNIVWVLPICAL